MMKKLLQRAALVLLVVFVAIQFIRPEKNVSHAEQPNDIAARFSIPDDIRAILRTSCYDCHSNTTRYPWYAEIQPMGWWLNSHITEGKKHLNFSEFGARPLNWQLRKLEEIAEVVREGEMPLPSYLVVHRDAALSSQQKERLISWSDELRQRLSAHQQKETPE
ncbi:MAG TPA: heme-binding domain-containing protein [Bacteroidota bacterium]|nr:heme-binding domain-containing protein [Bacteroidota bacterium]